MATFEGNGLYNSSGIGDLDPDDYQYFQQRQRAANRAYKTGTEQNAYQRAQVGFDSTKSRNDLLQQYGVARRGFGAEYTSRGLLNSGLYRGGLGDLYNQRQKGLDDIRYQANQQLSQLSLADKQLGSVKQGALNDNASALQARQSSVAKALIHAQEGY